MKSIFDSSKFVKDSLKIDSLKHVIEKGDSSPSTISTILQFLQVWPFWLMLFSFLTIWYFRKPIATFLNSFNKVKLWQLELSDRKKEDNEIKPKDQENELEVKKSIISEKALPGTPETNENSPVKEANDIADVWEYLEEKDLATAQEILNKIQSKAQNAEERAFNCSIFYYYKFINGFSDALYDLKAQANSLSDANTKSYAEFILGQVLFNSGLFAEAKKAYENSLNYKEIEVRNLGNYLGVSKCIHKINSINDAMDYIIHKITELKSSDNKAEAYKYIGNTYKENKDYYKASLAYLKALEFLPNDTDLLFKLAYNIEEAGYSTISSYFYNQIIGYKHDSPAVLNNIGVSYSRLGLKFTDNDYFIKAKELGNTLAASNLSNRYITAGLKKEATEILNWASRQTDINPAVWSSLESLNKNLKEESEKYENILKESEIHQSFLRHFADSYFNNEKNTELNLDGDWLFMKDKEAKATRDSDNIVFEFVRSHWERKDNIIINILKNNIGTAKWLFIDTGYQSPVEYNGYALYDEISETILILVHRFNEIKSCELSKNKIKSLPNPSSQ